MKELAAVDTRQGTALIEGGFKVYPQKILYSLPDREQYLYFKLILLSVYAPVRLRATDYVLQPGQYLTTYSKLAVATRVTRKQSISDIRKLIKRGLIACERHNGLLLITVLKYKEMQDLRNYSCYNNSTISNEGTPQGTPTEKNGHTKPLKTKGEPRKSGTPTEKNGHTSGQQKYSYLKQHKETLGASKTKAPPNPDVNAFKKYACDHYLKKFDIELFVNHGKDGKLIRNLLKTFSLAELQRRWNLFLNDEDSWLDDKARDIGMFSSRINRYVPSPESEPERICSKCNGDPAWRDKWGKCPKCGGTGTV